MLSTEAWRNRRKKQNSKREDGYAEAFYFSDWLHGINPFDESRFNFTDYDDDNDDDVDSEEYNGEDPHSTEKLTAMCGNFDPLFKYYVPHLPRWGELGTKYDYDDSYNEYGIAHMSAIPPSDPRYDERLFYTLCYSRNCWTRNCGLERERSCSYRSNIPVEEQEERKRINELMQSMTKLELSSACCAYCHEVGWHNGDLDYCCCLMDPEEYR